MTDMASVRLDDWVNDANSRSPNTKRLFVVVSGYENRARLWASKVSGAIPRSDLCEWKVIGFTDLKDECSRPDNDGFFLSQGLKVWECSADDKRGIIEHIIDGIERLIKRSSKSSVEVHVDYSSMPRLWYCTIFTLAQSLLRPDDKLYFWYTAGIYQGAEYPTAGTSDVSLFSGRPSLTPKVRTHLFGLGFDRIRASAIFRVLDPQNLVCFYADPGIRHEYVEKVNTDNRDLLAAAKLVFTAPVGDFVTAFSRIAEVTREFAAEGDVILVPDGPKPLVLASSLVPFFLNRNGIVSLHVRRRRSQVPGVKDVPAAGEVYGFVVRGMNVASGSLRPIASSL